MRNKGGASHFEGHEAVYVYYKNKARRLTANDEITSFYPKGGIVEMNYFGMGGATQYEKINGQKKVKIKNSDWHANTAENRNKMAKLLKKK